MERKDERHLELFYRPTCPYCVKVVRFMEARGVDFVTMHDITSEPDQAARLVEVGGKKQVPCLFIDGAAMYESSDIIEYLGELLSTKN
jgi:glutaredoxin